MLRLHITPAATTGCLFPCICRVVHTQGQYFHTVAMFINMIGYFIVGPQWCCQNDGELVLADRIACPVFYSCFWTCIGQCLEAESTHIVMGRLFGITYIKLYIIGPLQG